PLTGQSVADSLEAYMHSSEQLETKLVLNADTQQAAGLMLQQMPLEGGKGAGPTHDPDAWSRLCALAHTLQTDEHLNIGTDELAKRLFWEEEPGVLAERQAHFECTCSREKVGAMLVTLGKEELEDALKENPTVEVQCDFCNANYAFNAEDCAGLFEDTQTRPSNTLH
ncbi:MAG TPA: Hsp33 family molecular chaperone HslO, partial [Limnobacter sp.]|nr:Hsp33 family molecular chaperone HslO [Limnobacter sp.]